LSSGKVLISWDASIIWWVLSAPLVEIGLTDRSAKIWVCHGTPGILRDNTLGYIDVCQKNKPKKKEQ